MSFCSLSQRTTPAELDAISLGFRPVLGQMLAAAYNNPTATDTNKERLTKILHFWGSKVGSGIVSQVLFPCLFVYTWFKRP